MCDILYVCTMYVYMYVPGTKWEMMEQVRSDIRDFRKQKGLDKVINIFLNDQRAGLLNSIVNQIQGSLLLP